MELVKEWKQAHKLTSVQLSTAAVVVASADQWLPQISAFLPPWLAGVLAAASVVARLIVQPKVTAKARDANP